MKILMVLTSHNRLGNTGKPTGFWLEEFTAPPIDPKSDDPANQTASMTRFKQDPATQKVLANTSLLNDARPDGFDAIFYPGGHGPMWDLVDNEKSISLIEAFYGSGRPVAAVCHAPAVDSADQAAGGSVRRPARVVVAAGTGIPKAAAISRRIADRSTMFTS